MYTTLKDDHGKPFKVPHSNSFVDVNADGNADIFVTAADAIELWTNQGENNAGSHFSK